MTDLLQRYARVVGQTEIDHLHQLAAHLKGAKVVHINSTKEGGGVAEILHKLIPLQRALGLDSHWEVVTGESLYYQCTKMFHNGLQGQGAAPSEKMLEVYEQTNIREAERLAPLLKDADVVFIHDPQPAALLANTPDRKGQWIWRCHIDVSKPNRRIWRYLKNHVRHYDASIFSLPEYVRRMDHPIYLIPPSIDPLSDKNRELTPREVMSVYSDFGLDPARPIVLQVSRFDRFKDPLGVIESYRLARRHVPLQLVLAGGGASDDPEGEAVYQEVLAAVNGDPDIKVLLLPPDAHVTINALQRAADIVIQKSLREGFGLTVTEAMWKGRPVIGGDTGGIRLQCINHRTGFLVRTPEGAALRIRYLLHNRERLEDMGRAAKRLVLENFLLTRHLREHLALMVGLRSGGGERIVLEN